LVRFALLGLLVTAVCTLATDWLSTTRTVLVDADERGALVAVIWMRGLPQEEHAISVSLNQEK